MSQLMTCTACQERVTFEGRRAAIDAGWTFIEAVNKNKVKYWCLCGKHTQLAWLRTVLGEDKPK